jgi:hypothetical protein
MQPFTTSPQALLLAGRIFLLLTSYPALASLASGWASSVLVVCRDVRHRIGNDLGSCRQLPCSI